MKQKTLLKTMLLLCALIAGTSSSWAVDQVYKTLTFTLNNDTKVQTYEGSWTETVGTDTWTITNFNNNNWGWKDGDDYLIKCGRKRTGKSAPYTPTPSVATIVTGAAIDEAITKVVVTLTAINASDYNSIKLYMASNAEFDKNLVTVNVSPIPTAAGVMTITIPEDDRAANRFYKIEFDTKGATSSNGHTVVKKVEYYYDYVTTATLDHITLSGTYPTEFYVGDAFSHDGMTVTAHYDDSSTADVTGSATFTGYNMSSAGVQTVTVSYEEKSVTKTATYDITVNPTPSVVLTLDFATNIFDLPVGSSNKKKDSTGYPYGGYTYTLAAADGFYYLEATTPSSYKCLFLGKNGSTLTFPAFPFKVKMIKVYGTPGASTAVKQNIFVGDNPICTETTGAKDVTNVYAIPSAYQDAGTVYVLKVTSDHNTQISKIEILADAETVTLAASGYASYCSPQPLDLPSAEDYAAYKVTQVNKDGLTVLFEKITGAVPAGTPFILYGEGLGGTTVNLPVATGATTDPENNMLIGTLEPTPITTVDGSFTNFGLSGGSFVKLNDGTIPANKAYLPVPTSFITSTAPALTIVFGDDETTGIGATLNDSVNDNVIYDLSGRHVAQPTKGIYIMNGKKVVIK